MDLTLWKSTEETQYTLKLMKEEVETATREILEFGGLMTSPHLEREYCRALGYLDGLKYVLSIIEDNKDEVSNSVPR
jgi:hypothetical protein